MSEPSSQMNFQFNAIATVESCYKQKFAIPRQSGLAPSGQARIRFFPPYDDPQAFVGIEDASHLWIQFVFHQSMIDSWRPSIRPPRLGGNKKMGVFASRSNFRPNPIGLSVVKLEGVDLSDGVLLSVSGIDLLDQTPVLDIKPYVPYADRIDYAENRFAPSEPSNCQVLFSSQAEKDLAADKESGNLRSLITEVLRQDPRPAYQDVDTNRVYGTRLAHVNLCWRYQVDGDLFHIEVLSLQDEVESPRG